MSERIDCERMARELAADASFLHERLAGGYAPLATPGQVVERRLAEWAMAVGRGSRALLERRLAWDEIPLADAQRMLGQVELEAELPPWARLLPRLLGAYRDMGPPDDRWPDFRDPEAPVPFEALLWPVVDLATDELRGTSRDALGLLSPEAFRALQADLLRALAEHAAPTLQVEFAAFKSVRRTHGQDLGWGAGTACYAAFVARTRGERMLTLFREFPVLARWLASLAADWVDATRSLLARLDADRALLAEAFGLPSSLPMVRFLRAGLSDPHAGRQSVVRLYGSNGTCVGYKPKPLGLEAAFADLLAWGQEQAPGFPLSTYHTIDRDGYGWCEWLEVERPADPREARRYYEASGTLLALVYALNGADCHHENLIPRRTHPVLVDAETLLLPLWGSGDRPDRQAWLEAANVLNTALLPIWQATPEGMWRDISGIGASLGLHVDAMVLADPEAPEAPPYPAWDAVDAVIQGFEQGYRLVASHRHELPDGALRGFMDQAARFVPRHTYVYDALLRQLRDPRLLSDGLSVSMALETLCRPYLAEEARPGEWALVAWEQRSLANLDVPRLGTRTSSRSLYPDGAEPIEGLLAESGWQMLRRRLESLGPEDLAYQTALVRQALHPPQPAEAPLAAGSPRAAWVDLARRIGDRILEAAVPCPGGGSSWLTGATHQAKRLNEVTRMSTGLFNGAGGTAIFLGALARLGLGDRYAEVALQALEPLMRAGPAPGGLGLSEGGAAWVYSLVTVGKLLDMPELFRHAERAAEHLTPEALSEDRRHDLLLGSAGSMLALLRLYEVTGEPGLLRRASAAADQLLARGVAIAPGQLAWETLPGARPLTGFSHGAAGIGYALAALFGATGNPRHLAAARQAFAYERSLYDPEVENWPDFRTHSERPGHACSWCNGAPGIVLSRIGAAPWLGDEQTAQEVAAGLRTTLAAPEANLTLCCGRFGRAEVLWTAGLRSDRAEWQDAAVSHATEALESVSALLATPQAMHPAPFFQGLAGIGYQLLRLAEPNELPSVLLFEA